MANYLHFLGLPDDELSHVDLVEMNLMVAKSIPALANLDIPRYQRLADEWSDAVRERLPAAEQIFRQTPWDWKNDINFFRLGILCEYLENEVGIAYNEEQRTATSVKYTNPSDLFLNGVMDTRRGTCGNMATLHVAIGRKLGWPVSLACVKSHFVCRYDDGRVTYNIEATQSGFGGYKSDPDDYLIKLHQLPPVAIRCGSDLSALSSNQTLGVFIGCRGRHMRDVGKYDEAELDYLLARRLFLNSRRLYRDQMGLAVPRGASLFEPGEVGSPESFAEEIALQYGQTVSSAKLHTPPASSTVIQGIIY